MRKPLLLASLTIITASLTGCQALDNLCRFEQAKNEALFGWLFEPRQQRTVCCDPCQQTQGQCCDPMTAYGAPAGSAPCCEGAPGLTPGPVTTIQPNPITIQPAPLQSGR